MRQLLAAGFGVAGLLLMNPAASAQLANDTSTFNGEVAATCSLNGLNSDYALSIDPNNGYLSGGFNAFEVNANSRVKLIASYEILIEPFGFTPDTRKVMIRQVVGGEASSPFQALQPGVDSSGFFFLTDTPGTATAEVRMTVGPSPPPSDYSYRVTITCLL